MGRLLKVVDKIPESRRAEAYKMDFQGWTAQMENIRKYLVANG